MTKTTFSGWVSVSGNFWWWRAQVDKGTVAQVGKRTVTQVGKRTITETSSTELRRANRSLQGSQRSWENKNVYETSNKIKQNETKRTK